MKRWEKSVLDRTLWVVAERLNEGWDVSITGGDKTHVGAVTLAGPEGDLQTIERPGHKDAVVSRRWAAALAKAWGGPVCVRCGIHYDNAVTTDLTVILAACEELLETIQKETA